MHESPTCRQPLVYLFQPGALNESVSDVFGSLVKQRALNQTAAQADWLIGAGLFTPNVHGVALRSMKAPGTAYDDPVLGKDPQPAHMDDYVQTFGDNGGVHINSGIPNHAFYLVATQIGGHAWEKPDASDTRLCAIRGCARPRTSSASPGSRWPRPSACTERRARSNRPFATDGVRSESRWPDLGHPGLARERAPARRATRRAGWRRVGERRRCASNSWWKAASRTFPASRGRS